MCAFRKAERRKSLNRFKITDGCNKKLWMKKHYKEKRQVEKESLIIMEERRKGKISDEDQCD